MRFYFKDLKMNMERLKKLKKAKAQEKIKKNFKEGEELGIEVPNKEEKKKKVMKGKKGVVKKSSTQQITKTKGKK